MSDKPTVIDQLFMGVSGQAPWQRRSGQVSNALNVRFSISEGGAVKRGATKLVADLTQSDTDLTPLDGGTEYLFFAIRDAIVAIGDQEVHGWAGDGTPLEIIDETAGAFYTYLDIGADDSPYDLYAVTVSNDTAIVSNRGKNPDTTKGWSFEQCYNYIVRGDPYDYDSLGIEGFEATSEDDNVDTLEDTNNAQEVNGHVVRTLFDNNLEPAGYYIYFDGDDPYPGLDVSERLFDAYGPWYLIPNGKGVSGHGNVPSDDEDQGQGSARYEPETMPHRIIYDEEGGSLTLDVCPWKHRVSGNSTTNKSVPMARQTRDKIKDVQFFGGRLFLLGKTDVASSRAGDFFNLWKSNVNAPDDADPIRINNTYSQAGDCLRIRGCGGALLISTERGQLSLWSGDQVMTPSNARLVSLHEYLTLDIPIYSTGNESFIVDQYGDVYKYVWNGDVNGVSLQSVLTAHYPQATYGKSLKAGFPVGNSLFLTSDNGDMLTHDMFIEQNQLIQSAWGEMRFYEPCVFLDPFGGLVRVVTRDTTDGYSLLTYIHRQVPPPDDFLYEPHLDRMEIASPSDMTYDESTNKTTVPITGRTGSVDEIRAVTGDSSDNSMEFLRPLSVAAGEATFDGDLTGAELYVGFKFSSFIQLSDLYVATTSRKVQLRNLAVFHKDSTDYVVSWRKPDQDIVYKDWQAHRVGGTIIGSPTRESGFFSTDMGGVSSMDFITLSSDSPGSVSWTALELVVDLAGRGN